jgi:hypothetical protein
MVRSVIRNGDILGTSEQSNTGHIANCIHACDYLWMTGTEEGLSIYDIRDLDNPRFVKTMPMPAGLGSDSPGFTHDVFVDRSGIAWVTGEDGTFGYSTDDPENPRLVYRSDETVVNSGNSGPGEPGDANSYPLDFLHHNSIRTGIQLARARHRPKRPKRHSRAAERRYRRAVTRWRADRRRAYRTTGGGLGDVMAITEEDYARPGCDGQGSLQTWQIRPGVYNSDGSTKLELLDSWTTELNDLESLSGRAPATVMCSAHWFDEAGGILAQGWYDQGVRFLDVNDPRDIRQVGYWVTSGMFWAAYYAPSDPKREIVYGLDVTGGIDVLRIDRAASVPARTAPIPRRWMSGVRFDAVGRPHPTFGFACPRLLSVRGAPA